MSNGQDGALYEEEHVHQVYEQIADHFSSTRFKAWPIVERFLLDQQDGAVGVDAGCGNATRHQPHSAVVADVLALPHPQHRFDFAISIAVVHHLSTAERRQEAIRALLAPLTPNGRALIYVWALEQATSRRGWTENDSQDVMVPWVLKRSKASSDVSLMEDKILQRYYHLYRRGELELDAVAAGGIVLESGYEKDNWWAIVQRSVD